MMQWWPPFDWSITLYLLWCFVSLGFHIMVVSSLLFQVCQPCTFLECHVTKSKQRRSSTKREGCRTHRQLIRQLHSLPKGIHRCCQQPVWLRIRLVVWGRRHPLFTYRWHGEPGLSGDVWNISCVGPGYVGTRLLLKKPESEGRVHQVVVECCQLGCCKWAFWLVVQAELSWRTVDTGRDHTGAGPGGRGWGL